MAFPSVSICGCGWLGFPLAKVLVDEGYSVKGSTTTLEKISAFKKAGIFSFAFSVKRANDPEAGLEPAQGFSDKDILEFFASEVVVLTLPFRRDFINPQIYQRQIDAVIVECLKSGKMRSLIFTSSTSIYPDAIGNATEDNDFLTDNHRSKVLRDIEKKLLANTDFSTTVVRLSGLYGGSRKIGNFLLSKREVSGGESPVNLIHQDDAVGIVREIIIQREKAAGQIFNGCSDVHPTKKELYTAAANKMNLVPPQFAPEENPTKKIVVNDKVKSVLGYKFLHPNPLNDI